MIEQPGWWRHQAMRTMFGSRVYDISVISSAFRISILMSMSFIAATGGPFLSGFLASHVSHLLVFICIACCHLAAIIYALLAVKDIRVGTQGASTRLTFSRLFSLSHLVESWKICFVIRQGRERTRIIALFIIAFVLMTITAGGENTVFLF